MNGKEGKNFTTGLSRRDRRLLSRRRGYEAKNPSPPAIPAVNFVQTHPASEGQWREATDVLPIIRPSESFGAYLQALEETRDLIDSLFAHGAPTPEATEAFWETISLDPGHLAAGIEVLADRATKAQEVTPDALDTMAVLTDLTERRIPDFLTAIPDRNEFFVFNLRVAEVSYYVLTKLKPEFQSVGTLLSNLLKPNYIALKEKPNKKLVPEEKPQKQEGLTLEEQLMLIGNAELFAYERKMGQRMPNAMVPRPADWQDFVMTVGRRVKTALTKPLDEESLRLAIVATCSILKIFFRKNDLRSTFDLPDSGREYLLGFKKNATSSPEGLKNAIFVMAETLANPRINSETRRVLINLLVGTEYWESPIVDHSGKFLGHEKHHFLPIIISLANFSNQSGSEQELWKKLTAALLLAAVFEKDDVAGNFLFSDIIRSKAISDEVKLTLARIYLSSLIDIDPSISNEELLEIVTRSEWRFLRVGDAYIDAGSGRVLGHLKPMNSLPNQAIIFEENAEPAKPTPSPETHELTREEQITHALGQVFKQKLTLEEVAQLQKDLRQAWVDLNPNAKTCKRDGTLSAGDTIIRLNHRQPVRARENYYPRIQLAHSTNYNPAQQSDLEGVIYLGEDLTVTFYIDKNGELEGNLADLALEEKISWELFLQLNQRVISLTHALLVPSKAEIAKRLLTAVNRAQQRTERTNGNRRPLRSVEDLLRESADYIITTQREVDGGTVQEEQIDLDRLAAELAPGAEREIFQLIPTDPDSINRKDVRKGKARPGATRGKRVWLPTAFKPSRTAMENARRCHTPLLRMTLVKKDSNGVVRPTTVSSTFRSAA